MNQSHHQHSGGQHPGEARASTGRRLQRHHVFMLIGIVFMLIAMVAYVLSLDDSVQPVEMPAAQTPVAAPVRNSAQ